MTSMNLYIRANKLFAYIISHLILFPYTICFPLFLAAVNVVWNIFGIGLAVFIVIFIRLFISILFLHFLLTEHYSTEFGSQS